MSFVSSPKHFLCPPKEHGRDGLVDMTFGQMESAIESFVEMARLAGLKPNDLVALLDAGLDIKEILEIYYRNELSFALHARHSEPVE
jgi:hypothetical protein